MLVCFYFCGVDFCGRLLYICCPFLIASFQSGLDDALTINLSSSLMPRGIHSLPEASPKRPSSITFAVSFLVYQSFTGAQTRYHLLHPNSTMTCQLKYSVAMIQSHSPLFPLSTFFFFLIILTH